MGQSCEDCRKLEKHTYWTRFQSVRFIAVLRRDFHLKLRIPQEFVENLKNELPRNMTLTGPSGHNWDVEVTSNGNGLCLENGWPEFVKDHGLEKDDVLFFEYKGGTGLEVLMFNQSFCEKVTCYFVKKCNGCCHLYGKRARGTSPCRDPSSSQRRRVVDDDEPQRPSTKEKETSNVGTSEKRRVTFETPPRSRKNVKEPAGKGGKCNSMKGKSVITEPSTPLVEPKVEEGTEFDGYEMPHGLSSYRLHFFSKRRPVSKEEIDRTYELANEAANAASGPKFLISMQPTHVSCRFQMTVPVHATRKENSCLPDKDEDIVLVVEDKTWPARYTIRNHGKGSEISGDGWADFVFDNNIEKHDVCLFQPSHERDTYIIKVRIFRVVEPVVPLKRVTREMRRAANSDKR